MALSFQEFNFFSRRGWITFILFLVLLSFFLAHYVWQKQEMNALQNQKQQTLNDIEDLKQRKIHLQKSINCVNDPKWIEQQMIEKLGLVPRGYKCLVLEDKDS